MRRECVFFLIALTVQFSSAQLDLSFIDPFYYLYNLQNNHNFNNIHNINNNNNNNDLLDLYQQPYVGCISSNNQGTCMQGHECKYSRGTYAGRGNCTFLNSCCTYTKTCNDTVRARVVYFQNPANPRSGPSPCTLRLQLLNEDICQIRVDIMQLDLEIDNSISITPRICREYITVDPRPTEPIPQICGNVINNHFYIHLNRNLNNGYVNINVLLQQFAQNLGSSGTWSMRITQLECPGRKNKKSALNQKKRNENQAADDLGELAPAGCAQYYTQSTGVLQFFAERNPANFLANEYAACFKRFPNTCGVEFRKSAGWNLSATDCENMMNMLLNGMNTTPTIVDFCAENSNVPIVYHHPGPLYVEINPDSNLYLQLPLDYSLTTNCPP